MDGVSFLLYYKIKLFFDKIFTRSSQRDKEHKEGREVLLYAIFIW